ncbi:hypothetical protein [Ideonella sp. BN130291]|uniref:hypothetical protein n=1 Tax=Ideonella sp. BN130291 TaxID=3112940 RepID=UPI002E25FE32|nr:hypothetical protein [Ideonella sp. BN130291]
MAFHLKRRVLAAAAAFTLGAASVAQATPLYSVTQISGPSQWGTTAQAAVNNLGQVAWAYIPSSSTNLSDGVSYLFTPGVGNTSLGPAHFWASDLNDGGLAVGAVYGSLSESHAAALNTRTGQFTQLSSDVGYASMVNNRGDVVGSRYVPGDGPQFVSRATLYRQDGTFVDLQGDLFSGKSTFVSGINDAGQILLSASFFGPFHNAVGTVDGGFTPLPEPTGVLGVAAGRGLAENGSFTGAIQTVDERGFISYHAFIYQDGQYEMLPEQPGTEYSSGRALNDAGVVVGNWSDNSAFVYSRSTGAVPLTGLLSADCSISRVEDISDSGYIAAVGRCGGTGEGLLLLSPVTAPVPEPAQPMLLALGLAALPVALRRRPSLARRTSS